MKPRNRLGLFLLCFISYVVIEELVFPRLTAFAAQQNIKEDIDLITENFVKPNENWAENYTFSNQLLETTTYDSKAQQQNLMYADSEIWEVDNTTELKLSQVIPSEEFKVEPPPPVEVKPEEEEKPTPQESEKKPPRPQFTPQQQRLIQQLRQSRNDKQKRKVVIDALTQSAGRYPWIINPTDKLTFAPQLFKPNEDQNYIDVDLRVQESQESQIIHKFTYGNFHKEDQFYWLLDNNKLVFETEGSQAGIVYQGRSTNSYSVIRRKSEQSFWGLQSVVSLPPDFEFLTGEARNNNLAVISIAGQIINPQGIPGGRVVINNGVDLQNANATVIENRTPIIGGGSTFSPDGGAALFDALDAINTPLIIQAYPTNDLRPLLDDGNVLLQEGEIIPNNALESAGIFWGDIITGEGFGFKAAVSSSPGIKVAQRDKFDNFDLLNIVVNPFLSPVERDFHYLNSLFWISFGKRQPQDTVLSTRQSIANWHRLYVNYPHNRSVIQYDPVKISATYSSIFSSPGFSLTTNFSGFSVDSTQSINSTLGLALGGIFKLVKTHEIDDSLAEARKKFENGASFAPLTTVATPTQRREINQRLNTTLSLANSGSLLEQVSGTFTFPSIITPRNSNILQIRTGLHKRAVQFLGRKIELLEPGDTTFSQLQLSNRKFGPLTFTGITIPLENTGINPLNEASASQVILIDAQGRQLVQNYSSTDGTVVPLGVRTFDLAFDYMELSRVDILGVEFQSFNGELLSPSVELLTAGTSGNFNYSASLGTWLNIDANSAPGVDNNNLGLVEPTLGLYANFSANYVQSKLELDAAKRVVAINTQSPFLRINWNSASNRNNPFTVFLSYFFDRKQRNIGYSLAPGVAFVENNSNGEFIGLLNGRFSTSTGFTTRGNLEVGRQSFFEIEASQRMSSNFSLGAYLKNSSVVTLGLNSRVSGINYGAIFRYNFLDNSVILESKIGTGENGFDFQIQGGYRF